MTEAVSVKVSREAITLQVEKMQASMQEVLRKAAFAGAEVYKTEVLSRVPYRTGTLYNAVYVVYSEAFSKKGVHEEYHISWNKKKAPHGILVERGTRNTPARPFIRASYEAAKGRAEQAVKDVILGELGGSS